MTLSGIYPIVNRYALIIALIVALPITLPILRANMDKTEAILWTNQCLIQGFDPWVDLQLKTWDIKVTDDLFIRLHKKYANGRQELYSLNITRFNRVVFKGTAEGGTLEIFTDKDNIMKQTYHDPAGNIDTMLRSLVLPVKNIKPAQVDTLTTALLFLKKQEQRYIKPVQ